MFKHQTQNQTKDGLSQDFDFRKTPRTSRQASSNSNRSYEPLVDDQNLLRRKSVAEVHSNNIIKPPARARSNPQSPSHQMKAHQNGRNYSYDEIVTESQTARLKGGSSCSSKLDSSDYRNHKVKTRLKMMAGELCRPLSSRWSRPHLT